MPRDGSGVYSAPPGSKAAPNTTIESSKHNALVDDLAADANEARPIGAGGTGATSKQSAIDGLFDGSTTVDDDNLRIAANGDKTKVVSFVLSSLTTATTRKITMPDKDIVLFNGMDLIATLTTTSGTSHQVTGIDAVYRKLYIEVEGVSFNASDYLVAALSSTNGAAYGAAVQASPTITAGDNVAGFIELGGIRSSTSNGKVLFSAVLSSGNAVASQTVQRLSTNTAAPCNAIRFSANGGSAFDAGAIRIFGVR